MTLQLLFDMFTKRKKNQREHVEVSKETHKYSAAVLHALVERQRCVQTIPRMLSPRLQPRGNDGFLCRQKGEIEGGTGSNDKLCMPPLKRKTERKTTPKKTRPLLRSLSFPQGAINYRQHQTSMWKSEINLTWLTSLTMLIVKHLHNCSAGSAVRSPFTKAHWCFHCKSE